MDAKEAFVALNMIRHLGPIRIRQLLDRFGDPMAVLRARRHELERVPGLGLAAIEAVLGWEEQLSISAELARIEEFGCQILTLGDDDYPALLRQIYDPPVVLYVKGEVPSARDAAVAVVGTRHSTPYGRDVAARLGRQLGAAGLLTVSGGARGIDTAAHQGALMGGGKTVAVLGTGINQVFPAENRALFERISQSGALITQFPFHRSPDRQSFPIRNRIVAGMTLGTIVVEANLASGALITADFACDYGRQVFAVPGRVDSPRSRGCHELLRKGAALCESLDDVVRELECLLPRQTAESKACSGSDKGEAPTAGLSAEETRLLEGLVPGVPVHLDELVQQQGQAVAVLLRLLLRLEMKRLVRQRPGRWFERRD